MKYLVRLDASERTLADGRVLVPGEPIDLSKKDLEDEHNKRLVESGQLVEAKAAKSSEGSEP